MKKASLILVLMTAVCGWSFGQFAPAAGMPGSTAMYLDSNIFVGWADSCHVIRGWVDISDQSLFTASAGGPKEVPGPATVGGIVSLGDSGQAICTFAHPITNGPGFDFAVFENGFSDDFLELAFVEVSTDGVNYERFPAISRTDTSTQIDNWGGVLAEDIYNLAGKYRGGFGTPFDLEELAGSSLVNIDSIMFIRVVDVIGSIQLQYASLDSEGRAINDPWPTPFPTGGFDLDAIGVIHWQGPPTSLVETSRAARVQAYPNPITSGEVLRLKGLPGQSTIQLFDPAGRVVRSWQSTSIRTELPLAGLPTGMYILQVNGEGSTITRKIQILGS